MKTASTFKVGSPDMVVYVSQAQQISFVLPIFLPVSKHLPESHSEAQGELAEAVHLLVLREFCDDT